MRVGSVYRRSIVGMAAAVMTVSAGGCGSGVDPAAEAGRAVSAATIHGGDSGEEIILPVDAYKYTVPERNRLSWARDILIGRCMGGFGIRYDAAADARQNDRLGRIDVQDSGVYGNKRRYSVTDMATATTYGYHLVSTVTASPFDVGGDQDNTHGLGKPDAAKTAIMLGAGPDGKPVSRSASGRRIPAGGCVGAADAKLSSTGSVGEAKPVSSLAAASYDQSLKDTKVTGTFRAWSICMRGKGYHVTSPVDRITGFDIAAKTVSSREIATARADVACKQQTHLVQTWFDVEVSYQKKWIEQHADEFHQAKADHDKTMKVVSTVISSNR